MFVIDQTFKVYAQIYIFCPWPTGKQSGEAAIVADTKHFILEKLGILVPGSRECVWGLLHSKQVSSATVFKEIILFAFYSAPNTRKNSKLLSHLVSTMHHLLIKYPKSGYVMGGDKNKIQLQTL